MKLRRWFPPWVIILPASFWLGVNLWYGGVIWALAWTVGVEAAYVLGYAPWEDR